jgi:acyl CoA:acetate/3-ketoacid CoA transferase alpha subunit
VPFTGGIDLFDPVRACSRILYAQMNFGPVMATAAARVVVEVRAVLEESIPYERVQLPGLYVDRVVTVGA